jgi:O-antigen ligase
MGILMMLAIAPLHFGFRNIFKRLIFTILILVGSVVIFYSPQFQAKMFYSGSGTISDIFEYETNPDFNTSGRNTWKILMEDGLKEQPLFGNGPRSDLELFKEEGVNIKEAHNDYLAVRYNYGWLGLILLLGGFLFQFIQLFSLKIYFVNAVHRIVFISALTLFIPFFGFMYSDNILKYSHSFGCFHFALIGIAFSLAKQIKNEHYRNYSAVQ